MSPEQFTIALELAIAGTRGRVQWVSTAHHRKAHRATAPPFWWRLRQDPRQWLCPILLVYWARTGVLPAFHRGREVAELLGLPYDEAVTLATAATTPAGEIRRRVQQATATPWEIAILEGVTRGYGRWWKVGGRRLTPYSPGVSEH